VKVVVNKCYGGFSLSYDGVVEYAKRSGFPLFAYVSARTADGGFDLDRYVPYIPDGKDPFCIHYSKAELKDGKFNNETYFSDRAIPRDDVILIAVVEVLGENANGTCAELRIVEIPDGIKWVIGEYDGMEHVEEEHRSW
jgi:hypothetical protein